MTRLTIALVLAVCAALSPARQDPAPARAAHDYPPARHASVLRFFALEGDLEGEALRGATVELSTKEAPCSIVAGPATSSTRPDKHFVALELPATAALKDVTKSLRKCNVKVQELEWSLFRNAPDEPTSILGFSARDCVIGMANEIRWFQFEGGTSAFFYLPGKLDAEGLADRYGKLYQPLGGGRLGELANDTFTWPLAEPVDEAAARRAEKAIAKLPGVRQAKIDVGARTLVATVALESLGASAPPFASKTKATAKDQLSPRFDTNPVLDLLEKEHLALAPPKPASGD